jgi:hypothetical protein
MTIETANPRAMHRYLVNMEADLALGPTPMVVADATAATATRPPTRLAGDLAPHLLDGTYPSAQTKTLERTFHIVPSRLKGWHERE